MRDLVLREHGDPAVLSPAEYHGEWSAALAELERHRIISIRIVGDHVLVIPNQYSGNARCPAGRLQIVPRYPDVSKTLRTRFSVFARDVPLNGYDPAKARIRGADTVSTFLDRLETVVDLGMPFLYQKRTGITSSLTGSLDVGRTIRELESLGIHHLAVVRRAYKTQLPSLVVIIVALLSYIEDEGWLAAAESQRCETVLRALPRPESNMALSNLLPLLAEVKMDQSERPDIMGLCQAAEDLINATVSEGDLEYCSGVVRFRFTDSDALWERAVHLCLSEASLRMNLRAVLHPLRQTTTPLYPDGGPNIDPDAVVYSGATPVLVADAKDYAAGGPDPAGVYQVDSYARHLRVGVASLFYLSDGDYWHKSFGDTQIRVEAFGVTADGLRTLDQLRRACAWAVAAGRQSAP